MNERHAVKTFTAANTWTDPILIANEGVLHLVGTGVMTFSLQVMLPNGEWDTVKTVTEAGRSTFSGSGDAWRVGVASGAYTSGEMYVMLKNAA